MLRMDASSLCSCFDKAESRFDLVTVIDYHVFFLLLSNQINI